MDVYIMEYYVTLKEDEAASGVIIWKDGLQCGKTYNQGRLLNGKV